MKPKPTAQDMWVALVPPTGSSLIATNGEQPLLQLSLWTRILQMLLLLCNLNYCPSRPGRWPKRSRLGVGRR